MTLLIEHLKVEAIIGILPEEREKAQTILVDGSFSYVFVGNYLDYVAIKELITQHLISERFGLLEEALVSLHRELKESFEELTEVNLTLKKPDILRDCLVGASLSKHY